MNTDIMFETTEINGMTLANRFVRSATWEGMAGEDGACTPRLVTTMARLAEGGVGLIVTGHAYVERRGQAGPRHGSAPDGGSSDFLPWMLPMELAMWN